MSHSFFPEIELKRRWYDRQPELVQATERFRSIPPQLQRLVAELIVEMTDLKTMAYPSESRLRNLGSDRVLGLMRSQYKRRWYDRDPVLYRAFVYLLLVTDTHRVRFARRMNQSVKDLVDYSEWCKQHQVPVDLNLMRSRVRQVFVHLDDAQLLPLSELEIFTIPPDVDVPAAEAAPKEPTAPVTRVFDTESGMRVLDKSQRPKKPPGKP